MDFSEKTPFPKDPFFRTRSLLFAAPASLSLAMASSSLLSLSSIVGPGRETSRDVPSLDPLEALPRLRKLPWPSNPCFFGKARVGFSPKKQGFSFRGTPESLEKRGKTHQKSKKDRKAKKARKSKKARIGGSGFYLIQILKGPENWCRAKIVEKYRKYFWHFLTIFDVFCPARKNAEKCRKVSKIVLNWRFLTCSFPLAPFVVRWLIIGCKIPWPAFLAPDLMH